MKKFKIYISKFYYCILSFYLGYGSLLYWFAKLEHKTYPRLPTHSHWSDNYFIWCEYLIEKSTGKNVSFKKMKLERIKKFREELNKITEEMNKRDMSWFD
jgi:hypothetical protein